MLAGAETTYHLLGSALSRDAARARRCSRRCARIGCRIALVLEETLRWESPIQIVSRMAVDDVEIAGTRIERGRELVLGIGVTRTATKPGFPSRTASTVDRRGEAATLAFGLGRHYCAGSRLAILEATVAINALLDRVQADLRLEPAVEVPARQGRLRSAARSTSGFALSWRAG